MNRRYFVGLLASGVAGYAGAQNRDERQTTPPECPTGTPSDGLVIVSTNYEEVEGEFLTEAGVRVEVANESDVIWSYVEVSAAFRDGEDTIVTDGMANMLGLPPRETWRTYISNIEPEAVESATVEITDSTRGEPYPTARDLGLTLENSRLAETGPTVIGQVTNTTGGPLDYLEAYVRFRDDEYVYDGTFTNVTNFAADDTWRFEVEFVSVAPEPPTITDYDLGFST